MSSIFKYLYGDVVKKLSRDMRKEPTKAEKKLWKYLRNRRINNLKFLRQHPIYYDDLEKESFFIADFYCNEVKLVVEVDGEIHKERDKKDKLRTEILNQLGFNVIRFGNEKVLNEIDEVVEEISRYQVEFEKQQIEQL